jgi:flagellar motility protein MotE (MotC chaperone)
MDYDELTRLRERDPGWKLLRADTAPMVAAFLHRVFIERNIRSIEAVKLAELLDDELYEIDGRSEDRRFPKAPKAYVDDWTGHGWLRRFYPKAGDEPHVELAPAAERALRWVESLRERQEFIGTASRLSAIFSMLRELVHGTEENPDARLARLEHERSVLDEKIDRARAGEVDMLGDLEVRERYQQLAEASRQLLSDFGAVKQNFRELDRQLRERIARWEGGKGELVTELVGDRDAISDSDQGRSFQAFYDFLMSPTRQRELVELLERVQELEAVNVPDPRLRRVHHDWLDAAEDTQSTVRSLSAQLRRFLDDQAWVENRRVVDLLKKIEQHALDLRGATRTPPGMEIDALAAEIVLPFERPLYRLQRKVPIDSDSIGLAEDPADPEALFSRSRVDRQLLADHVHELLRTEQHVNLVNVVERFGLPHGLAELVGYLSLRDPRFEVVFDADRRSEVSWAEQDGRPLTAELPVILFTRATTLIAFAEE